MLGNDWFSQECLQVLVNSTPAWSAADYARRERDQLAVLDYIIGNCNRTPRSWLTRSDGKPISIEHRHCFPGRSVERRSLRSDFVDLASGVPLEPEIIAAVRAVDTNWMSFELHCVGLSSDAIAAVMVRLAEVSHLGMIRG
ncbi:hypothetical protein [Nocardia brasiliensis]